MWHNTLAIIQYSHKVALVPSFISTSYVSQLLHWARAHSASLIPLALGQPFQRLPHGLPGVCSSSSSPTTGSSGHATSVDSSWQLHVLCRQPTKHISLPINKSYFAIPLFCIPHFTVSPILSGLFQKLLQWATSKLPARWSTILSPYHVYGPHLRN